MKTRDDGFFVVCKKFVEPEYTLYASSRLILSMFGEKQGEEGNFTYTIHKDFRERVKKDIKENGIYAVSAKYCGGGHSPEITSIRKIAD